MFAALVYATVFFIAVSGLVYQLLAGAVASYVLGDSVTQFSLVVGAFLSALGLGAHASRRIEAAPGRAFVDAGYAAAIVGGTATELLFLAYARSGFFRLTLYGTVLATGVLVGLELPLLLRVLRRHVALRELAARALAADYAGAVVGSIAFALFAIPRLGLVRAGLAFGALHAVAALAATWVLGPAAGPPRALRVRGAIVLTALALLFVTADRVAPYAEDGMYPDPVIFAQRTPYQRIVVTQGRGSWQLFLDGNLQFASADEHRYHEALVHPVFAAARSHREVLVLGGGDGLATREILRYADVAHVTLVDLDRGMTALARSFPALRALNGDALGAPRVRVVNDDAMVWLAATDGRYDVVVVDFPDPNNFALGKLYTTRFYALLKRRLAPGAVVVVQSTSPMTARQSFWCIARTMEAAGFSVQPYHAAVPSFGEWGYVLASSAPFAPPTRLDASVTGLRYLTDAVLPTLFVFPRDMDAVPAEINRLNNQVLVQYYDREWRRYN